MTNLKLSDREWREFKIGDICHIKSGVRLTKQDMIHGDVPFIGATDSNNGITEFVSNKNESFDANVLGVNYNESVVENFYHPYGCIFSDDVKRLELKEQKGNKWIYLFLKSSILRQKEKYQYGYKFNTQRMGQQKILLPVKMSGIFTPPLPYWQFMEAYIKQKEQQKIRELMENLSNKALQILTTGGLKDREWKEFKVEDLFEIYTGALVSSGKLKEGDIPRITATDNTNGIAFFTQDLEDKNFRTLENFISISFLGSVFYHPYKASLDMKIHAIKSNQIDFNRYNSAFLIRVIKQFAGKYAYGNQLSTSVLKQQKIMLPVKETPQGSALPDWEFMEDFMRKIEQDKIKTILEHYKNMTKCQWGGGKS